jgi:signal transduction histidine kinase
MVQDETQRAEYLRTLCIESDRLASLIDNVLNYARLENGRANLHVATIGVEQLLIEMQQMFEPRTGPAGKTLVIEDRTPPSSLITTDFALVRQVLANLLENAFKHTTGACDPRVWLRANREPDGCFVFQVEDGGPGIPLGDQNRIFSPFWHGRGNNGCPAPGVGLGLALARRWTQLLGGTLRVDSPARDRLGARFTLVLPSGSCRPCGGPVSDDRVRC